MTLRESSPRPHNSLLLSPEIIRITESLQLPEDTWGEVGSIMGNRLSYLRSIASNEFEVTFEEALMVTFARAYAALILNHGGRRRKDTESDETAPTPIV